MAMQGLKQMVTPPTRKQPMSLCSLLSKEKPDLQLNVGEGELTLNSLPYRESQPQFLVGHRSFYPCSPLYLHPLSYPKISSCLPIKPSAPSLFQYSSFPHCLPSQLWISIKILKRFPDRSFGGGTVHICSVCQFLHKFVLCLMRHRKDPFRESTRNFIYFERNVFTNGIG